MGGGTTCVVSDRQRGDAKRLCYAILYGLGPAALAEQMGVSVDDAAGRIRSFLGRYPAMRQLIENIKVTARRDAEVRTMFGRRRMLDALRSGNREEVSRAERQCVSAVIQASLRNSSSSFFVRAF